MDISFDLKYCRYVVHEKKRVLTIFPSGKSAVTERDLQSPENIREAESEGYSGSNCVWQSLVEHELLHNLVAEVLFDRPSSVMLTETGIELIPLWQRYEEEMLVLSMQEYLNKDNLNAKDLRPINEYGNSYSYQLERVYWLMKDMYRPALAKLYAN